MSSWEAQRLWEPEGAAPAGFSRPSWSTELQGSAQGRREWTARPLYLGCQEPGFWGAAGNSVNGELASLLGIRDNDTPFILGSYSRGSGRGRRPTQKLGHRGQTGSPATMPHPPCPSEEAAVGEGGGKGGHAGT